MTRYVQIVLVNLLALGMFACSPVASATEEAMSKPQPTPPQSYYPLTTRTGIVEIDHILDIVANGNIQSLRALIQLANEKCTQRDGLGGPPKCRAGEVEGTPVEVLPFLGPEGSFLRKDEIENWSGIEVSSLYAIYEVSPEAVFDEAYPLGKYVVMFMGKGNEPAASLRISDGRIVRIDYNLDDSPATLNGFLQREASKVILAPPIK